ncbi:MAG: hypothetical protein AB8B63_20695 [Granulosicoccus sp.]
MTRRFFKAPLSGLLLALLMFSTLGGCALPVPAETENQAMPEIDDTDQKDIPESEGPAGSVSPVVALNVPQQGNRENGKDIESATVISYDGKSVVARVISNGCTSPADFSIQHTSDDGSCIAIVVRNRPDYCRKVPEAVQVEITWPLPADCGDPANVRFANPLLSEPVKKLQHKLPID